MPYFSELSATRVYLMALEDRRIRDYLPDNESEKPINRKYLFNVSLSVVKPLVDREHNRPGILRSQHSRGVPCS